MSAGGSPGERITILNYHSVSNSPARAIAPFTVTPSALARHLDLISAGGHSVLTVGRLADVLRHNEELPDRTVVISFDDGFADNLTVAAPLLAERLLPATIFVTTGFLAGPSATMQALGPMLSWNDLADLERAGIEIGAHAHTHQPLDGLGHRAAHDEIRLSKHLLEAALGHPVDSFAYPHGYASRWVEDAVRRSGFHCACGVGNAFSHRHDNRWHMSRLTVGATTSSAQVAGWLEGSGAHLAGARERLRTKAWRATRQARNLYRRAAAPDQTRQATPV